MARFRGTLAGRGKASRLGSERTGLTATAGGWSGHIAVEVYTAGSRDRARVLRVIDGVTRVLWEGWLDGLGAE